MDCYDIIKKFKGYSRMVNQRGCGTVTLKECYTALGGDYEGVVARLGGEGLVKRFVRKFLLDESYSLLRQSLEEENYKDAFRAAHTLKGVCQSLHFTRLCESSESLCDMLRTGCWRPKVDSLFLKVDEDYKQAVQAIQLLDVNSAQAVSDMDCRRSAR